LGIAIGGETGTGLDADDDGALSTDDVELPHNTNWKAENLQSERLGELSLD
jgi:hypothetical protein